MGKLAQIEFFVLLFGQLSSAGPAQPAAWFQLSPEHFIGIPLIHKPLNAVLFRWKVGVGVHGIWAARQHRPTGLN